MFMYQKQQEKITSQKKKTTLHTRIMKGNTPGP
jgi:hypothetical protein